MNNEEYYEIDIKLIKSIGIGLFLGIIFTVIGGGINSIDPVVRLEAILRFITVFVVATLISYSSLKSIEKRKNK